MRNFASFHPAILFFYYIAVIFTTMFMMHPLILLFSLIGSLLFYTLLTPAKEVWKDIGFYMLIFLLIAVTNPIFVHKGETILFFLNDNPVTLEAIIYGVVIATMLVAVIFWSKSYSYLMTSDKFIYLFGKAIPKLSLVISMALRFIPLFKSQIKKVNQTQKTLGLYTSNSMTDRILSGVRTFNSMLSWSLENSISQADSMKARGYGLKGRTSFSLFKWKTRDALMLSFIIGLFGMIIFLHSRKHDVFHYYPYLSTINVSGVDVMEYVIVFMLMILPSLSDIKENLQWKYLRSKM